MSELTYYIAIAALYCALCTLLKILLNKRFIKMGWEGLVPRFLDILVLSTLPIIRVFFVAYFIKMAIKRRDGTL